MHFALNGSGVPYKTCDVTMDVQPGNMAAESIWHSSSIEGEYEVVHSITTVPDKYVHINKLKSPHTFLNDII